MNTALRACALTVLTAALGCGGETPGVELRAAGKQEILDALARLKGKVVVVELWGEF